MRKAAVATVVLLAAAIRSHGYALADEAKSLDVAKAYRACSGNDATGCIALGLAYEDGDVRDVDGAKIERNYRQAVNYFEIACKAESAFACSSIGGMYRAGKVKTKKPSDADVLLLLEWTYYERGCVSTKSPKDEVALACSLSGNASMRLALSTATKKKMRASMLHSAFASLSKACQLGNDGSCRELAKMNEALDSSASPASQ